MPVTFDTVLITAVAATSNAGFGGLFSEAFGGADGTPWPAPWVLFSSVPGGAATIIQQTGRGRQPVPNAGGYPGVGARRDVAVVDVEVTFDVNGTFDSTSGTTAEHFREYQFRLDPAASPTSGLGECYFVSISPDRVAPTTGSWRVELNRRKNGVNTVLAPVARHLPAALRSMKGRIKIANRLIQVRIWDAAAAEPTAWNIEFSDDSVDAIMRAGSVAFAAFGGNVGQPSSLVEWDNIAATGAVATPVVTASSPAQSAWNDAVNLTATAQNHTSSAWSVVSAPAGSTATVTNPTALAATFVPDKAGRYVFRVTGSNAGSSASADVTVNVYAQMWQRTATGKRPVKITVNTL